MSQSASSTSLPDRNKPAEWLQTRPGERCLIQVPAADTSGAYSLVEIVSDHVTCLGSCVAGCPSGSTGQGCQNQLLQLYHTINSVGAQKVRIQFAEKGLSWKSNLMTLRGDQLTQEYLQLNPNGVVPTLIHDNVPVIESTVILFYIEECFPSPRLLPREPRERASVRMYTKLIDEYVHNACTIMTFATALRSRFLSMKAEARERYLSGAPNQKRAEFKRDVIANGLKSPFVGDAVQSYFELLRWIDRSTREQPFLAGEEYSLADIAVVPYLVRLDLLRLSRMWENLPSVQRWYDRVAARAAVRGSILNSMTGSDRALFEESDVDAWPEVLALMKIGK
jgi:glutathione S-transferase